jgi:hypothetical protein
VAYSQGGVACLSKLTRLVAGTHTSACYRYRMDRLLVIDRSLGRSGIIDIAPSRISCHMCWYTCICCHQSPGLLARVPSESFSSSASNHKCLAESMCTATVAAPGSCIETKKNILTAFSGTSQPAQSAHMHISRIGCAMGTPRTCTSDPVLETLGVGARTRWLETRGTAAATRQLSIQLFTQRGVPCTFAFSPAS